MLLLPISLVFYRTGLIVKQYYTQETLQPATVHHPPVDTVAMQYHRKTRCVFFKPRGSNLSQFFRIQFKEVRLELLAPICKREKSDQSPLSTGVVPPCSRWGCRQTLHQSFSFPVGLSLSLTDTGNILIPPGSTTQMGWRCTRGRPDGIPD